MSSSKTTVAYVLGPSVEICANSNPTWKHSSSHLAWDVSILAQALIYVLCHMQISYPQLTVLHSTAGIENCIKILARTVSLVNFSFVLNAQSKNSQYHHIRLPRLQTFKLQCKTWCSPLLNHLTLPSLQELTYSRGMKDRRATSSISSLMQRSSCRLETLDIDGKLSDITLINTSRDTSTSRSCTTI